MDIRKLNPWNWFKHEEKDIGGSTIPVRQGDLQTNLTTGNNPFAGMMQLHREIDRLFESIYPGLPNVGRTPLWGHMLQDNYMPAFHANVNVTSDDKHYIITLEAPGLEQKDISIELKDRALFIKGNKQQEKEEKDKHIYRMERYYGSFQRVLSIPDDGDIEEINATMRNGVLKVNIPRMEIAVSGGKKITIN